MADWSQAYILMLDSHTTAISVISSVHACTCMCVCSLFVTTDLPMAGGLVLLPKKLVRKSDWMRVDLPRPDSPGEGRENGVLVMYTN